MTTIDLSTTVRVPEIVQFRQLDEEAVLLNLDTGFYFSLNSVGARIWQLLLEHCRLDLTLTALESEFDADRQRLQEDLLALVSQLTASQLLEVD